MLKPVLPISGLPLPNFHMVDGPSTAPTPVISGLKDSATCRPFKSQATLVITLSPRRGTANGTTSWPNCSLHRHMPHACTSTALKSRVRWQNAMRAGRGRFRGHRTYNDSSLTADNISGGDGAGSVQMDAKYVSTQVRSELASTRSTRIWFESS
jgi:hypothetical protein